MKQSEADSLLPTKPTRAELNPLSLVYLLIATPKWGKTTFFMKFPNAILLACEEGHKFQRGFKLIIDKWDQKKGIYDMKKDKEGVMHMTMDQAIDALEASKKFDFVIIDTLDMAVKMCLDYHSETMGVEHPSDLGFGKGYDQMQNTPLRKLILRILKSGRGVGLITHTKTEIERFSSGEKARKETTLPSGIMRFAYSQADVIMHGEFGRKQPGNRQRDRVLVCEGDMDTMAGNRTGALLPARFIVSPTDTWKQFSGFFKDSALADKAEREYRKSLHKDK